VRYLLILFFSFLSFKVYSQNSFYNNIGKNRIQYKSFKWNVVYTNNFEIYYNSDNDKVERIASEHLENNFSKMTSLVGHQPFTKTKVFIFHGANDSMVPFNESILLNENINNSELLLSFIYEHKEIAENQNFFLKSKELLKMIYFFKNFFYFNEN